MVGALEVPDGELGQGWPVGLADVEDADDLPACDLVTVSSSPVIVDSGETTWAGGEDADGALTSADLAAEGLANAGTRRRGWHEVLG